MNSSVPYGRILASLRPHLGVLAAAAAAAATAAAARAAGAALAAAHADTGAQRHCGRDNQRTLHQ